ncbi:YigZ family protein [Lactiplantibacillus songbeiensis]|uniref:YigZ family protein n=1 Tax=Lactiplantibacillus songbeiensis TaxID=2559920 RepID=A0ABW4BXX6_9LACO|nr:YigZ family protein [Lactiplantibacillus songbeiensis]
MSKPYYTIATDAVAEQTIKKSRFIVHLYRITDEPMAQAKLAAACAADPKATHHCFAYMLGTDDHIQRMSDDGEPSGTAGVPILEALKLNELHDVLAVVTRYFGGIKLGAGGLIRAYNSTPVLGIQAVGKVQRCLQTKLAITLDYKNVDTLNYYLNQQQLTTLTTDYGVQVTIVIAVNATDSATTQTAITNLLSGQVSFDDQGQQFTEIPVAD